MSRQQAISVADVAVQMGSWPSARSHIVDMALIAIAAIAALVGCTAMSSSDRVPQIRD